MSHSTFDARREFLKFLAASPYVASIGGVAAFFKQKAFAQETPETTNIIKTPAEALDVFDFEQAAHHEMLPGHWAYMETGVQDEETVRANREGYKHIELRPRRLRDVSNVDMHVNLFGTVYDSPIFLCPTGSEANVNKDAELAVAKAAKARGTLHILGTTTSTPIEEVTKALGRPVWYQLYAPTKWEACEQMLRRVEASGCSIIALTVDNTTGRNTEPYLRARPKDMSECAVCHGEGEPGASTSGRPMYDGIDMKGVQRYGPSMDWAYADRIRKFWKGKFLIKGMDTREDARLCVEHGIDGMIVSNHGGRATETSRATIEALPEVVAAVAGRIPILVDGGVRRGTDAFKALAMGAKAVGIGRPFLWGLGAFGQAGVDRVLQILQAELKLVMANCGTRTVAEITRAYVATPGWRWKS